MARAPLHTDDIKIEQKDDIVQPAMIERGVPLVDDRKPEIVAADPQTMKDVAADLAFMEEPVTIVIQPSQEENAPTSYPAWVNGKGAEVLLNGRWVALTYLPVGNRLITKRKYVAVLLASKTDRIQTEHDAPGAEVVNNRIRRRTSATIALTVVEDKNPKGAAWLTELYRRNF